MARCEKLLEKARQSPTNVTFRELRYLVECFGFQLSRSKGSHFIYKAPDRPGVVTIQEGKDGKAKSYQVKQVLELIEQLEDRTGDHGSY